MRHPPRTEDETLRLLRERGARELRSVRFRANRSTIWSLTRGGRRLNLHEGYRTAPETVLAAFAVIVREARARTPGYRRAAAAVRSWEGLVPALARARRTGGRSRGRRGRRDRSRRAGRRPTRAGPCCATRGQRALVADLYRRLAATRFARHDLPGEPPLRLSRRMTSGLGHMMPGRDGAGRRTVVEIALSLDLMLEGNEAALVETLAHEMAHAVDWLTRGGRDHGPAWRRLAAEVGCRPRACADLPVRRRASGREPVTRVPPADDLPLRSGPAAPRPPGPRPAPPRPRP